MPSNHLILCRPLLLPPSIFPSTRVFSNESVLCIRWPKYWSFSFNISHCNDYPGLISFRMDWLDLAVQGTLKNLLQHHSSKISILWRSAFFIVQLSHPYTTTGKTIAVLCPSCDNLVLRYERWYDKWIIIKRNSLNTEDLLHYHCNKDQFIRLNSRIFCYHIFSLKECI